MVVGATYEFLCESHRNRGGQGGDALMAGWVADVAMLGRQMWLWCCDGGIRYGPMVFMTVVDASTLLLPLAALGSNFSLGRLF